MQDKPTDKQQDKNDEVSRIKEVLDHLHDEEDGRNKEWEDRARVNLEKVPPGTKTNLERDFEPEELNEKKPGEKERGGDVY